MLILLILYIVLSNSRILELTQKNVANALRYHTKILVLYHNTQCKYSQSYAQKFTSLPHPAYQTEDEGVGMVDCLQQKQFCIDRNITRFPMLVWLSSNGIEFINPYLYMGGLDVELRGDEYVAATITALLRSQPYFVVVLFQEIGMSVLDKDKPLGHKYYDRILYLSQGKTASTLLGFVGSKSGCWVFHNKMSSNSLIKQSCGSTYQQKQQLLTKLQHVINSNPKHTQYSDASNYKNQTILGYKQLQYWLDHHSIHLDISTHKKVSICKYLYIWTPQCNNCDYQSDLSVMKFVINRQYKIVRQSQNLYMKQIHSYDIQVNSVQFNTSLPDYNILNFGQYMIVPNIITLCFTTSNNRLPQNTQLHIYKLQQIITTKNVQKYIKNIIKSQQYNIDNIGNIGNRGNTIKNNKYKQSKQQL